MRRAAENRPCAIVHQDEIGDPDRQFPVRVERVAHGDARWQALLLGRFEGLFRGAHAPAFGVEGGDGGIVRLQRPGQRMIGRDRGKARPQQRVGPRGIDRELFVPRRRPQRVKGELQAAALADPVGLHQAHLVGPAFEPVDRIQQFLGEVRDAKEPLGEFAPLDLGARTPALAVDHLLVGQHRPVDRVPVHRGGSCGSPARPRACRGTSPAAGRNIPGRRWRIRGSSRSTAPSA
jgi:hypothetical protein